MRDCGVRFFLTVLLLAGSCAPALLGQALLKVYIKNATSGRLDVCINGNYQGYVAAGKTMHTDRDRFATRENGRKPSTTDTKLAQDALVGSEDGDGLPILAWSVGKDGAITFFRGALLGCQREIPVVCGSEELPSDLEVKNSTLIPRGNGSCVDAERNIQSALEPFQGKYSGDGVSADFKVKDGIVKGTIKRGRERIAVRGAIVNGQVSLEETDGAKAKRFLATDAGTVLTLVDGNGVAVELQKQQLPRAMPGKVGLSPIHSLHTLGMDLVFLKPGKYSMGSISGEADERPLRTVELGRGFYLGRTEVTQAQFREIMKSTPWSGKADVLEDGKAAASYISFEDADLFCRRLNELDRMRLPGFEYRLPTEAEWEYACRAGTTGNYCCPDDDLEKFAVFGKWQSDTAYAHPVATRQANGWGLYDMHGNVWEWCQDWYAPYELSETRDPVGPKTGVYRVTRGGSWDFLPAQLRSAERDRNDPRSRFPGFGFRVALAPSSGR